MYACLRVSEGVRAREKKERERDREAHGVREIGMIWREKCRGREMIYFPCRYDDRAIGESTKEKTRERERANSGKCVSFVEMILTRGLVPSNFKINREEKVRFYNLCIKKNCKKLT